METRDRVAAHRTVVRRRPKRTLMAVLLTTAALLGGAPAEANGNGFERWPVVTLDGQDYLWAGAPDGPNGETDVPGHSWREAGQGGFVVKHFNTGPFGAPSWWSSDAPDGALLYIARVQIDEWTPEIADRYARRGYMHYHEMLNVDTGEAHPTLVGWFKHTAVRSFTLDGGPAPQLGHDVRPGIDREFIANWATPYVP